MQAGLEGVLAELVLGPAVDSEGIGALLTRHALGAEERAAFETQLERFLVYRKLVRNTLRKAVELAIPRTVARLGSLFDEYFERFLAERGPRTHYLRDVTTELLDFVEPLFRSDARVPPWAHELARHEALEIVIASLGEPVVPRALGELDAERGLAFIEAARVVRYEFAVQRLPASEADRSEPARESSALFVYRDAEHDVRYLELSALAAGLVERLLAGESLKAALLGACTATGTEPGAALAGAAALLADLAARGALIGPVAREDLPDPAETSDDAGTLREKGHP
jgi:hypothetical protein